VFGRSRKSLHDSSESYGATLLLKKKFELQNEVTGLNEQVPGLHLDFLLQNRRSSVDAYLRARLSA
jgi:hypothetical protein